MKFFESTRACKNFNLSSLTDRVLRIIYTDNEQKLKHIKRTFSAKTSLSDLTITPEKKVDTMKILAVLLFVSAASAGWIDFQNDHHAGKYEKNT